jgi:hypothetical protein
LAPSLVITELNDEIIKQLMENKNCRVDLRPIFEASKAKRGDDKLNSILDIEFIIATAHNSHCENDDKWRLWVSFILIIVVPTVFAFGGILINHLIP